MALNRNRSAGLGSAESGLIGSVIAIPKKFWRTPMRKATLLQATLWIEGKDQPAHNFVTSTTQSIEDNISFENLRHPSL